MDATRHEAIRRIKARVEGDLLRLPGVTGVDIGYKSVGGVRTGELAIRVLVRSKRPSDQIPPTELIPPMIDGVPTDVIERVLTPKASPAR